MKTKSTKLNRKYLTDGDALLNERMKDPEFKKVYEEESLKCKIALAIYRKRKEKKLSQAALAKKVRTTQRIISQVEQSEISVGVDLLGRIANALELKVTISSR
jgi:ribosome-binding protein aMBF1 (putative translation factor)